MPAKDLYNIHWRCYEISEYCSQMSRIYFDHYTNNAIVITLYSNDREATFALRSYSANGDVDSRLAPPDQESLNLIYYTMRQLVMAARTSREFKLKMDQATAEGRLELIINRNGTIEIGPNQPVIAPSQRLFPNL